VGTKMNLWKGFDRLIVVLSLLTGPIVFLYLVCVEGPPDTIVSFMRFLFLFWVIGLVAVCAMYGLVRWLLIPLVHWIVEGFHDGDAQRKRKEAD